MVIEEDIALAEPARNAKAINLPLNIPGVDHSRLSQRSEGHHKGGPLNDIICRFVPIKDFHWICPGLTPQLYPDYVVIGVEEIGLLWCNEHCLHDSRDAIFWDAPGENLRLRHNGVVKVKGS